MIRINLLTEARAADAKKKGPALPTGARLNNLILIGGLVLGVIYIATMGLVLTSRRRHLDEEIGKAKEEVARLKSIIDEVKSYEDKKKSLEEKIAQMDVAELLEKSCVVAVAQAPAPSPPTPPDPTPPPTSGEGDDKPAEAAAE